MKCIVAVALLALAGYAAAASSTFDIRIPESVKVEGEDAYVCITRQLPDKPMKLVGVEPLAKQEVVHHILIFGCEEPFARPKDGEETVWECKANPTCAGRQEAIMYGWGRNAPKLELPAGVGFSVGKSNAVKWVVVQLHYLKEKPAGDSSGVRLRLQDSPVPYSAGLLSYASWFTIPPHKKQHFVLNHCCYRGFQPLVTFAVRVHTHTMGRQVFMKRAPTTNTGSNEVVAMGDPLKPQGFTPVQPKTIWPGERLTVGCEFDSSDKKAPVSAGADHNHEMCNMYLMVYSDIPHIEMCSDGTGLVDEHSPGNMPHTAALLKDPFPLWKPPAPTDKLNASVVGNIASVATGGDGTIWVLTRGGRVWGANSFDASNKITDTEPIMVDVVMQLHPDTGKVLRQWGSGHFFMPHMIRVDRNNSVWVADVGRHQVLQFSPSGQLIRAVGKKMTPGHDKDTLCKPTQVAFLNDGSFIVSDGYCNSRAVRYNPDGSYHSQYELPDKATGAPVGGGGSGMGVAHSVVLDECDDQVLIADREGKAVHRFGLTNKQLTESKSFAQYGKVWSLMKGPYGRTLALCWQEGQDAVVVDVDQPNIHWKLPNSTNLWPHDFALGAAALPLTGAGDRLLALYVAPLCESCGPLEKYVVVPKDFGAPPPDQAKPVVLAPGQRPPLAHLGGGSHQHPSSTATAAAATAANEAEAQEKVLEKEAAEDAQEAEALSDPNVIKELQQQVAELQRKVSNATNGGSLTSSSTGSSSSPDTEEFEVMHGHRSDAGRNNGSSSQSWGSFVAIVSLSVALGVLVGGLALHALHKNVLSRKPGPQGQPGSDVRYTRPQAFDIQNRLAEDEETEGAGGDTLRLLTAGTAVANGNGLSRR